MNWKAILKVLSQRSTITGIIGLVAALVSSFGVAISPEIRANLAEVALAIVSIVAIVMPEKPKGGQYHPDDYKEGDTWVRPDGKRFTMGMNGFWMEDN